MAELEQALLAGEIDLAVHSAKDLPGELAEGLALLGAPARAASEDVLCGAGSLEELGEGARVGTSSIRRMAQLRAAREDLDVVPLRGNVDTRLGKLAERDRRAGRDRARPRRAAAARTGRRRSAVRSILPASCRLPDRAPSPCRAAPGTRHTRAAVTAITDSESFACLLAERAVAQAARGSLPHAASAPGPQLEGEEGLRLRAWVGLPDGSAWASDELAGRRAAPEQLGLQVAERLRAAGAGELLRRAEEMAGVGSI